MATIVPEIPNELPVIKAAAQAAASFPAFRQVVADLIDEIQKLKDRIEVLES